MSSPEDSRKTFFVDPVVTSYEHVLVTRMLNYCNLPIVHFTSKRQVRTGKVRERAKSRRLGKRKQKYTKKKLSTHDVYDVFVIFFNFSFLALPGDFWVAPKGVFSNSRQSLPVSGTGIADSNRSRDYGFLELSEFPKPWIPEIYTEKFPGFRIQKISRNPQSVLPYIGQSMGF